jgi:hypothetical protein
MPPSSLRDRRRALNVAAILPRLRWFHAVIVGLPFIGGPVAVARQWGFSPLAMALCALVAGAATAFILNEWRIFVALMLPRRVKLTIGPQLEEFKETTPSGMPIFWFIATLKVENTTTEEVPNLEVRLTASRQEPDQPFVLVPPLSPFRENGAPADARGCFPIVFHLAPEQPRVFDIARKISWEDNTRYHELCFAVPKPVVQLPAIRALPPDEGWQQPQRYERREYLLCVTATGANTLPAEEWFLLTVDDKGRPILQPSKPPASPAASPL